MRIALLTCAELPEPDPDERPLLEALHLLGVDAQTLAWDAPNEPVTAFDAVVIRATWNYHEDLAAFRDLLDQIDAGTRLLNPRAAFEANHHKGYLADFADRGIPVVPTTVVPRHGSLLPLAGPVVIKPAVGCGSAGVRRFDEPSPEATAFLAESVAARDTLLQPVLAGFAHPGERSLVWIDGSFTHGVRKQPRFAGQEESVAPLAALDPEDLALAEVVVSTLPPGCVFARVDLVDHEGRPVLSELEAIEPSLFFGNTGTQHQLAAAIVREAAA